MCVCVCVCVCARVHACVRVCVMSGSTLCGCPLTVPHWILPQALFGGPCLEFGQLLYQKLFGECSTPVTQDVFLRACDQLEKIAGAVCVSVCVCMCAVILLLYDVYSHTKLYLLPHNLPIVPPSPPSPLPLPPSLPPPTQSHQRGTDMLQFNSCSVYSVKERTTCH